MKSVKSVLAIAVLGTFSTFSATALADGHCLHGNTVTCITEEEINLFGAPGVEYTIDNNSGQRLFSFGVSNPMPYGYTDTFNLGWSSRYISKNAWNDGKTIPFEFWEGSENDLDMSPPSKVWVTGTGDYQHQELPTEFDLLSVANVEPEPPLLPEPEIVYLGSFESLFGTEDYGVSFYWNAFGADTPLSNGVTLDNFFYGASPASDFSTFGSQGNVITTSVAAVPEPETYAMFLAGLGLMAFVARRKQS